jgi:hypothetical protein
VLNTPDRSLVGFIQQLAHGGGDDGMNAGGAEMRRLHHG